ncbi:hypothetical protein Dxin01_02595 [Deinococcus xinjiangensis]|uniref:Lipoprotein n=1 Tax=Deinococcus xinjiangensis TaxID=457454 RepID=A0ABP9VFK6_9DEIO
MKWPAACLLPMMLCACQDTAAREQNAALAQRVAALEAKVQALEAAQPHAPTIAQAANATALAAAQNCAVELSRTLETYKQSSTDHRYPAQNQLDMPDACTAQNVQWQSLKAKAYAFSVNTQDGQELASGSGP